MLLDPLITDLFDCIEETHARTKYERDPVKFCELENIQYVVGPSSLARSSRYRDGPDIIVVQRQMYGRDLFTITHEMAHVIAKREGYIRLIRKHHKVTDMKRHIELLMNEGGARLLMPAPDLYEAIRNYGDTPRAIQHLMETSGASQPAAMRRWVRQDLNGCRAAFEIERSYVIDVASWHARLPFRRHNRVPEIALEHPDLMLLGLGHGRVLGTLAV